MNVAEERVLERLRRLVFVTVATLVELGRSSLREDEGHESFETLRKSDVGGAAGRWLDLLYYVYCAVDHGVRHVLWNRDGKQSGREIHIERANVSR